MQYYTIFYPNFILLQMNRFKRKRKAPTPRKQHVKILRKDVTTAAESLLELSEYTGPDPSIDKDCTESITVR